jgi:GT2 family glycosyltransferase
LTLGIVIVSFRCRDLTLACLASVRDHAPELLPTTVVVDNASGDGTLETVHAAFPEVRTVRRERNVGFAGGANAGLRALDTDVMCLLNPDAILVDSSISKAADYLAAHAEVGLLGGKILNGDGTVQASARAFPGHRNALFNRHSLTTKFLPGNRYSRDYLMTDWNHDAVRRVDWVSGAFMFIHRRAIERIGLLDANYFFSIEDVDYCRRLYDAGLEVHYFPDTAVEHRIGGSSRRAVYRAMAAHHRGMWRYYQKYLRGDRLLDILTATGIAARFGLHASSYALRTGRNRILGRENP